MEREKYSITEFNTPVYRLKAKQPGPTTVIVSGLHGNEVAGWEAAELIRLWSISQGEIVVIPTANKPAAENRTRGAPGLGDINRDFPTGSAPTSSLAQDIWSEVTRHDPDFVIDLHRSIGLYQRSPSGVGMAIFPTPNGRDAAENALKHLNKDHVPKGKAKFRVGNDQSGYNSLLSHKVGGDLDAQGWLIETTTHEQSLTVQKDQLEHAVETLLYHATGGDLKVTDYGHHEQEPRREILEQYDDDPTGETDSQKKARRIIKQIRKEFGL